MAERVPRIGIGLPVYNGEQYIADAIESLQEQKFDDFEVVISDNASTDSTEDVVREAIGDDRRFRYTRLPENIGANRNFNRVFAMTNGELFKWAAHDDVLAPGFLLRCVERLDEHPQATLAHTRTSYIGSEGEDLIPLDRGYIGVDGVVERMMLDDDVTGDLQSADPAVRLNAVVNKMSVFYDIFGVGRRRAFERTLLLRSYYGADKVILAELALLGPLVRDDEVLFARRCHQGASTRSDNSSRAAWSDPVRNFNLNINYAPLQMIGGYLDAIGNAGLSAADQKRCRKVVASKLRTPVSLLRGL